MPVRLNTLANLAKLAVMKKKLYSIAASVVLAVSTINHFKFFLKILYKALIGSNAKIL
jgi:hypothetical protein